MVIARRGGAEVFCLESYIAYIHSAETIIKAKLSLQRAPKFLHGAIFRYAFQHYKAWQTPLITVRIGKLFTPWLSLMQVRY
jgi:hypothetical protein